MRKTKQREFNMLSITIQIMERKYDLIYACVHIYNIDHKECVGIYE